MSDRDRVTLLPLLPIKNTVSFPYLLLPLSVGRPGSAAAIGAAIMENEKTIVIVAQRDAAVNEPGQKDLFTVGTRAAIKTISQGDDRIDLMVFGLERVTIMDVERKGPTLYGHVRSLPPMEDRGAEVEALYSTVLELAQKALALAAPEAPQEMARMMLGQDDPIQLVYLLAAMLDLGIEREQALLEATTRLEALRLMHDYLSRELQVLELRSKIATEARTEISKEQREYLLRQQLRAIQQELGAREAEHSDTELLQQRLEKADLPDVVRKEAERELKQLGKLPAAAPDYHVIRSYLEFVLELPWRKSEQQPIEIGRARQVLDEDHYDLTDVKQRIIEQLAVLWLNPHAKAPIFCFTGPPGVGKTSLGQSIARAMGRKFEHMSLGGLHDEAELRGHRRTYVGAMPGRIVQAIRRAGVNNPVLMLDEVDKLGQDFRGDPSAALLEILDPEQNRNFHDNYLDLPFDLSKVLFITTANAVDTIPRALLDRMEVLSLAGYSEEEKIEIARRYLIPRQLHEAGLTSQELTITTQALKRIIERYTREAGLRQLERAIARMARKVGLRLVEGKTERIAVGPEDLDDLLGPEPFLMEELRDKLPPGVATGLAWTEAGGDVLYVEAALLPEGRDLTITGHLGEVMQESARAAHSYIWSHSDELGIDRSAFRKAGVHIHVPSGAIAKDGPSAGVTMVAALASLFTRHPSRSDTAMTGEITLAGLVLPVGGVKEKVLAAHRAGLRRIILPTENRKDLSEIPADLRDQMEFIFVSRIKEVLPAVIPALAEPRPAKSAA